MTSDLLTLTGRDGATLHLLATHRADTGLEAEGWIVTTPLRAGRVFTAPDGQRYKLPTGLKPGIRWDEQLNLQAI